LIIQETGAPESCDDVASVESSPWVGVAAGAADSGGGALSPLLPQEDKTCIPIMKNKIACSFLSICSSRYTRLKYGDQALPLFLELANPPQFLELEPNHDTSDDLNPLQSQRQGPSWLADEI
jgi:hypothetical protein